MGAMGFVSTLSGRQAALELDFVRGRYRRIEGGAVADKSLADLVTVTRTTAGSRFNASGAFEMVAANQPRLDFDPITKALRGLLLEEQRTNLFPRSADWGVAGPTRCTIKGNAGLAPDGTLTAARMTPTGEFDPMVIRSAPISGGIANKTITFSVFINCDNTTQKIGLYLYGWTNTEEVAFKQFDPVPGWRRYEITKTFSAAPVSTGVSVRVDMADGVTPAAGSSMLIWGGQVEVAPFASSHIPTPAAFTSRASTATFFNAAGGLVTAAVNEARGQVYEPDGAGVMRPAGQLLEQQRTNLVQQSGNLLAGATYWASTYPGSIADSGQSWSGMQGARIASGGSSWNGVRPASGKLWALDVATYCLTFFYKAGSSGQYLARLRDNTNNLEWGFFGAVGTQTPSLSTAAGGAATFIDDMLIDSVNGVRRLRFSVAITTAVAAGSLTFGPNTSTTGNDVILFGVQVEKGATPSSYIPTTTATVTRAADVFTEPAATRDADLATVNSFSSWFNPLAGSLLVEASANALPASGQGACAAAFSAGASINERILGLQFTSGAVRAGGIGAAGVDTAILSATGQGLAATIYKGAIAFRENDARGAVNGALTAADTLTPVPAVTALNLGRLGAASQILNGYVRRLRYFPARLSDNEISGMTE